VRTEVPLNRLRRWSVFSLVGLGGFFVQIVAIALLTRVWGWPAIAATAVALELAALHNFAGHSRWTWSDRRQASVRAWLCRYGRFQVAKTASLAANLAVTAVLGYSGMPTEIANTAAVLLCALPNFMLAERFVFDHA
jgi:putative flippase GtrA